LALRRIVAAPAEVPEGEVMQAPAVAEALLDLMATVAMEEVGTSTVEAAAPAAQMPVVMVWMRLRAVVVRAALIALALVPVQAAAGTVRMAEAEAEEIMIRQPAARVARKYCGPRLRIARQPGQAAVAVAALACEMLALLHSMAVAVAVAVMPVLMSALQVVKALSSSRIHRRLLQMGFCSRLSVLPRPRIPTHQPCTAPSTITA
jgi:hypothetical protein